MPDTISWMIGALDTCDPSMDLIVCPEGCNAMSAFSSFEAFRTCADRYQQALMEKGAETAKRCRALVAMNLYLSEEGYYRNVTLVFGPDGEVAGQYFKQHIPDSEHREKHVENPSGMSFHRPYILEVSGIRYGFLTCYDCYFHEYIQHLASARPDVLIVCSLQRGERADMLYASMKDIAFTCNANVVRASVSMGGLGYAFGGQTMVVSPAGKVLAAQGQKTGILCCEIEPKQKYFRPDTFEGKEISNDRFIDQGREPWAYRACGAPVVPGEKRLGYPRLCAHRGFNTIAPENSLPAFGAAVALGADEIELDIWPTRDGELIVSHDGTVDRLTGVHGAIMEMTWEELERLDAGERYSSAFRGLRYVLFGEVLRKFSRQTILNLHVKTPRGGGDYDPVTFRKILDMLETYDMLEHVYISGDETVLKAAVTLAPDLPRTALDSRLDFTLVKLAKKYQCQKVQFYRGYYRQDMVEEAKAAGMRCNLFWSDDPEEIPSLLDSGIDTILTNDYLRMSAAFVKYLELIGKHRRP